jgi:septum site-determining protein MinC
MSTGTAAATESDDRWGQTPQVEARPAAILKGGPRGLEILVQAGAAAAAIAAALTHRLEEAPGFFRGSDVRVRIDGALPAGCLATLDEIATRFELAIVEIGPRKPRSVEASAPVVQPALAAGTAPAVSAPELPAAVVAAPAPATAAPAPTAIAIEPPAAIAIEPPAAVEPEVLAIALAEPPAAIAIEPVEPVEPPARALAPAERTRMVVGPVRSGVILDHPGNLVVLGDVNPGAEVRAEGNIVILGRLRGIAHAGIGRDHGFILALRLEPQQLRIGRLAARAPDASSSGTEIAYVTDKNIVVEGYAGKLPFGLAAGI